MSDNIFRVRFAVAGGHVRCRLFAAPNHRDPTFAKCGDFTVRRGPEFRDLVTALKAEFVQESGIRAAIAKATGDQ